MSDANRDERVSRRAYELWEQEGGEHGRHDDHWHRAAAEHDAGQVGDEGAETAVAAPDGTTLTVPNEEVEGDAPKPARKRAAPKAKAETAAAPASAKAPAKPRKPKAK